MKKLKLTWEVEESALLCTYGMNFNKDSMQIRGAFLGMVLCLYSDAVWAAGAYIVDDADITPAGKIQSESWISHSNKGQTVAVVNGAYQIQTDTELTLQETHDIVHHDHTDLISPEIKYVWRKGEGDTVMSSLVVGGSYITDDARLGSVYAYVPASVKLDKLDVNVNLGAEYVKEADRHLATWGLGTEYHFTPEWSLVSEVFGEDLHSPGIQLGPHYMVKEGVELDLIYGRNVVDDNETLVTAGLTLTF